MSQGPAAENISSCRILSGWRFSCRHSKEKRKRRAGEGQNMVPLTLPMDGCCAVQTHCSTNGMEGEFLLFSTVGKSGANGHYNLALGDSYKWNSVLFWAQRCGMLSPDMQLMAIRARLETSPFNFQSEVRLSFSLLQCVWQCLWCSSLLVRFPALMGVTVQPTQSQGNELLCLGCHASRMLTCCWLCAVLQTKLFGSKAAKALQKSILNLRCCGIIRQGSDVLGCALHVCVCVCWGLTPMRSKCPLNELVPERTCTASRGSLSETSNWLDIEVRHWETKVVPRPAFLIQLGPDKIAAGKTTNQIRWQFSTVSNYCCSQGGPDKINQMLEWFSHFWFLPHTLFFPYSSIWRQRVMWMWIQGELKESLTILRRKCEGWFMGWITWKW